MPKSEQSSQANFYVYIYFRLNGQPCYVGKGKGSRWLVHEKWPSNIRLKRIIAKSGGELPKVKIRQNLTEPEAFEIERAFIKAIGRGKNGPLVNMTDGGEGFTGGRHTPKSKEVIGARTRGKTQDPAHTAKISKALKGRVVGPQSPEQREKSSKAAKASEKVMGRIDDLAKINTGRKLPAYHIEILRNSNLGAKRSDEARASMSAAHQRRLAANPPPTPWVDLSISRTTWYRRQRKALADARAKLAG